MLKKHCLSRNCGSEQSLWEMKINLEKNWQSKMLIRNEHGESCISEGLRIIGLDSKWVIFAV